MVTYEVVKDKNTAYAGEYFILITIKVDCKNISDNVDSLLFLLYSHLDISGSPFLCLSLFPSSQRGNCNLSSWISYHFHLCWFVYTGHHSLSHVTQLCMSRFSYMAPLILTMKKLMMMVMSTLKTKLFTVQTT